MYRPITLANSDYKIILRVWSTRLGPILNDIVGEHQKGFIPTRDGRENIIVVQAVLDRFSNLLEGGVIFLDLKKAFDRVSHDALLYMLQRFRFPEAFINTVKSVYSCSRVQLVVNRERGQEIPVESGTKQGCPLSPLLFTIIAEVLTQAIVKVMAFKGELLGENLQRRSLHLQMIQQSSAKILPTFYTTLIGMRGQQECSGTPTRQRLSPMTQT